MLHYLPDNMHINMHYLPEGIPIFRMFFATPQGGDKAAHQVGHTAHTPGIEHTLFHAHSRSGGLGS